MLDANHDLIEEIGCLVDRAALDLSHWQGVIDTLARAIPGTRVLLQVVDPALARAAPMLSTGWDRSVLTDYARYYGTINPWVPAIIQAPAMTSLFSERVMSPRELHRSEFYQDYLRVIGEADASMGVKLVDQGGRLGAITLSYDARHAPRVDAHGEQILMGLAPRMRRALDVGRTVAARAWHGQVGSPVMSLADAALVVTRDGCLLDLNAAAEALIAMGSVLRIGAGDRVLFSDPRLATAFTGGVRQAIAGDHASNLASGTCVSTREGDFALSVLAMRPDMLRTHGLAALLADGEIALVVIRRHEQSGRDIANLLKRRYGLTAAETRLTLAMDGSRSLRAVAEHLGITHETARTQIKAVFVKLGVSRQSQLVAIVLRLSQNL